MHTIILRLVDRGATDGDLHGLLELPGRDPVPFADTTTLLTLLRRASGDADPAPAPTTHRPG